MLIRPRHHLGRKPDQVSADAAGYCSEANLEALENRSIDGYVPTGRARDAVEGNFKGGDGPLLASPKSTLSRLLQSTLDARYGLCTD